jgi:hypothetical protein
MNKRYEGVTFLAGERGGSSRAKDTCSEAVTAGTLQRSNQMAMVDTTPMADAFASDQPLPAQPAVEQSSQEVPAPTADTELPVDTELPADTEAVGDNDDVMEVEGGGAGGAGAEDTPNKKKAAAGDANELMFPLSRIKRLSK